MIGASSESYPALTAGRRRGRHRAVAWGVAAAALAILAAPGPLPAATPVEAGAVLGLDQPFGDEAVSGILLGIQARIGGPSYSLEPGLTWFGGGDFTDVTSLSFNAISRGGLIPWLYWTGGLGWSWVDLEGAADADGAITYNIGAGVEIPAGALAIDLSPRFFLINTPGDGHREHLLLMLGVHYRLR